MDSHMVCTRLEQVGAELRGKPLSQRAKGLNPQSARSATSASPTATPKASEARMFKSL